MKLHTVIYTTAKTLKGRDPWYAKTFPSIYQTIKTAKGVEVEPFTVNRVTLPQEVPTYQSGGTYIVWDWIRRTYPAGTHNAVCLHISRKEAARIGLKHPNGGALGGAYNTDRDAIFDFVVIADSQKEFTRLFLHELSHGFAHWTMVPDETHTYDYTLKDVPALFPRYDFTKWNVLKAMWRIAKEALGLAERLTPLEKPKTALWEAAVAALGTEASPKDMAPDYLGCAESVSSIVNTVVPFPIITGTWSLWVHLKEDPRFTEVTDPKPGDIIISPTGSVRTAIPGHTGILDTGGAIMSNTSETGLWERNYTEVSWAARYGKVGYPTYYFRHTSS